MTDLTLMRQLAEKWLTGTITEGEKAQFETWYNEHPDELLCPGDTEEGVKLRMLTVIHAWTSEPATVIEMNLGPKQKSVFYCFPALLPSRTNNLVAPYTYSPRIISPEINNANDGLRGALNSLISECIPSW
jgi:hypothetical protein